MEVACERKSLFATWANGELKATLRQPFWIYGGSGEVHIKREGRRGAVSRRLSDWLRD